MKEKMIFQKNVSRPSNPPDELTQNVSKKKKNHRRTNYSYIFSAKVQNLTVFFIYLHDSFSIFRARRINSEWVSRGTVPACQLQVSTCLAHCAMLQQRRVSNILLMHRESSH